ncbi:MAG: DUF5060 domain-containing protein, partial [Bacteroidota bacterium]
NPFRISLFSLLAIVLLTNCNSEPKATSSDTLAVKKWDVLTLDFMGPTLSETSEDNPFLDYRLVITFSHEKDTYRVPGYFAADGNAAETSAKSGNVWRVKFRPNKIGTWNYLVSFVKGKDIAINEDLSQGMAVGNHGDIGTFEVVKGDFSGKDFRAHGQLTYQSGTGYQQFAETKKYFIKGGAGSPENFLAYAEFDDTRSHNPKKSFLKTYDAHVQDWQTGDPTWQDGKGKGIIGALNYLASKGMNSIYFLTMNIQGDGEDIWMYESLDDFTRFDCSKLDQWEIVFEHAQRKGILLHLFTQETENELLLDEGNMGIHRRLYYRELTARYGHHLALNWNIGEENGVADFSPRGQNTEQRKAMAKYFQENNGDNLVALHTLPTSKHKENMLPALMGDKNLDAISFQISNPKKIYTEITKWKQRSEEAGQEWIMYLDEIGPHWMGVMPDANDMAHDTVRRDALWGALMAGAAGVEWYFGYKYDHSDLTCQDWRTRDKMWDQTRYAMNFFNDYIPFWEMKALNSILKKSTGHVFGKQGKVYVIYQPFADANALLQIPELEGKEVSVAWYNPRQGGDLINKKTKMVNGDIALGAPPEDDGMDWVALVKVE